MRFQQERPIQILCPLAGVLDTVSGNYSSSVSSDWSSSGCHAWYSCNKSSFSCHAPKSSAVSVDEYWTLLSEDSSLSRIHLHSVFSADSLLSPEWITCFTIWEVSLVSRVSHMFERTHTIVWQTLIIMTSRMANVNYILNFRIWSTMNFDVNFPLRKKWICCVKCWFREAVCFCWTSKSQTKNLCQEGRPCQQVFVKRLAYIGVSTDIFGPLSSSSPTCCFKMHPDLSLVV